LRRSTTLTATFAALQNIFCTEARQGRSELRQVSNPGEEHPFGVEKRVASYLQFCGQAQNGKTGAELKGAISLGKCES
jgi:hypothetical protein